MINNDRCNRKLLDKDGMIQRLQNKLDDKDKMIETSQNKFGNSNKMINALKNHNHNCLNCIIHEIYNWMIDDTLLPSKM